MNTAVSPGKLEQRFETVSFDDEPLILVDGDDRVTGYDSKLNTHLGSGKLHRAFSVFLFDGPDWVLLQQRAEGKLLWPGYWANSCCSHPRRGETWDTAANRRTGDELGVTAHLSQLFTFRYRARYRDVGTEHELCAVYVGQMDRRTPLNVNREEIADWSWMSRAEVDQAIRDKSLPFAPWFLLEWEQLKANRSALEEALQKA
ncbi:MAG: isopentenyl-diphosphate Delta-isomerase [Halieaceae bacterium]|jgi:isopentenyl-diphosphate delta-isomerase|nr:isopentenyl-diphosphate Delta-isomerase [Halieaceae bacterium]